ncbi:heme exporter protein CcmD [Thalassotalea sp. 1_MG-2023]|uniref:heme exporter protein CcmD n=1 Tax=Thalassotalea sp. 1_MG-2023 TaxID=3062680 RepID=UPI0026E29579|nr:heme exporter protein CcmD [Thalassotalea sp. 1_MG-2023]MDO6428704.1 heme exporter protein CcmD [Thalassotalea sp. 1_MG-2023]
MQFSNFAEFIAMDGHGFYVWLSYGFTFAIFVILALFSNARHHATLAHIKRRYNREKKLKQAALEQNQGKR